MLNQEEMDNFNNHIDSIEQPTTTIFHNQHSSLLYPKTILILTDVYESDLIKESYFSRVRELYSDPQPSKCRELPDCPTPTTHLQHNSYIE